MPVIVVMGVSGSGKSTVARLLAEQLGWSMLEGDSLHSSANIERMRTGRPLTDEDRREWLTAIAGRIAAATRLGRALVVSCSALKRRYRDRLRQADPALMLVYLAGDEHLIRSRLAQRHEHFMPPGLLNSQFATLEEPAADERAIRCDIAPPPTDIAAALLPQLVRYDADTRKADVKEV